MNAPISPDQLPVLLRQHKQERLLAYLDKLAPPARQHLAADIANVDFALMERLYGKTTPVAGEDTPQAKAARATALEDVVRQPASTDDEQAWQSAHQQGLELLKAGKVAAVLVAGGQGTRLGFPHPKGMFPIGPVSNVTLFQIFFEQIKARSAQAGVVIPYYIMTSDATHEDTEKFLEEHNYFGLDRGTVRLFKQGTMPAVDAATGQLLVGDDDLLVRSPDGHGGILNALAKNGIFDQLAERGIEYLYYHQVDNPTGILCEPALLGFHAMRRSDMTTKVAAKRSADEKMGVLALVDGKTEIIEYSDMPTDVAEKLDSRGNLMFWAGNMAVHVFNVDFLRRITFGETQLPYHTAHKKVPFKSAEGEVQSPKAPNAYKFERFIFDALPLAHKTLVVEADRKREFNPVKNAEGNDSPATSKEALINLHRSWLQQAGVSVPADCVVEISPLFALDAEGVQTRANDVKLEGSSVYLK
ncbi:UTP--glucose-1-phosphate uridylyltransferase [Lacunimicrobium album]